MSIKLLYLIPSLKNSGGMERVLTDKVNYLIRTGCYDVTIVTTDMKDGEKPFYNLNSKVIIVNFEIFFNNIFNLPLIEKIKKSKILLNIYKEKLECYILKNGIDICISMGAKELEFFSKLKLPVIKIFESHFNPTVRSSFISDHKGNSFVWRLIGKYRDWQYRQQTKKLDQIVVLTKSAELEWKKTHSHIKVINNPSPFIPVDKIDYFENKRVIAIGRLEDQKGYDLLIDCWKKVYHHYPDWKLDIYGEGTRKNKLAEMIKKNNLQEAIHLKGITKDVQKELLLSDFFVMSSRYEGLPMVLLESIACGLPIVSFDCPTGPAEIIENNDCGVLVRNGDVHDLGLNIIKMIENRQQRFMMSKNALEKTKKYSIEKIMLEWDQLFVSLMYIK
ncbi:glycosyltransferase family 4 protein [Acinetobacter guillouiae]|uniref:glycosyltransferase family 4 protein n=1 Tax=Acinetobacter guillouiae TaxID=106649 RepID=UPI003AF78F35